MLSLLFIFLAAAPRNSLAQNNKAIINLCCPQKQIFINNPDYEYRDDEYEDDDDYPNDEPATDEKEVKPIICSKTNAELDFSQIKIWDNLNNRLILIKSKSKSSQSYIILIYKARLCVCPFIPLLSQMCYFCSILCVGYPLTSKSFIFTQFVKRR